ncbi:MAG: hypothetical protein KAH22_06130 [Thiotrichaceae bacterium]|nr:hypothetical protein [Thiotrichaceae bacterium]
MKLEEKYPNFFIPFDEEEEDIMRAIENDDLQPDEHSEANMTMPEIDKFDRF